MSRNTQENNLSYSITKQVDRYNNQHFTCDHCSCTAKSVAAIKHKTGCQTIKQRIDEVDSSNPKKDGWNLPFSKSTIETIGEIVNEFKIANELDHTKTFIDNYDNLESIAGVKWTAQGSTSRIAIGLGRTSPRGEFHLEDRQGIVLKVDPRIRYAEDRIDSGSNIDEIETWQTAIETETTDFFAEIIACAPDGMWLIMEECIPISASVANGMGHRDMIRDEGRKEYINPLRGILQEHGWSDPDHKHGNIGLSDDKKPVLLDYGTRVIHETEDTDQPRI